MYMYTTHNKRKNKERINRIQKGEGHRKAEAVTAQTIVKHGTYGDFEKGGWRLAGPALQPPEQVQSRDNDFELLASWKSKAEKIGIYLRIKKKKPFGKFSMIIK